MYKNVKLYTALAIILYPFLFAAFHVTNFVGKIFGKKRGIDG